VIYLYLDRYSGNGPMTEAVVEDKVRHPAPAMVLTKAA
jgi:hypothetical protein